MSKTRIYFVSDLHGSSVCFRKFINAAKVYGRPIVTKVSSLEAFFAAEAYHQDYLTLNPTQGYIVYNDLPKIENLKRIFPTNYSEKPTLVSEVKVTN